MRIVFVTVLLLLAAASPAAADTFAVDNGNDVDLSTCGPADNDCTLRGAITKANATTGPDTITLPALRVALRSELPRIDGALAIQGTSARSSIIDGTGTVGTLLSANFGSDLTLADLQVTGAQRTPGDGDTAVGGPTRVERVAIVDNQSTGLAAFNGATIVDSLIARNTGDGVGGVSSSGATVISNSTVTGNTAAISGVPPLAGPLVFAGGVINVAGLLEIDHSTIADNHIVPGAALLTGVNLGSIEQLHPSAVVRSSIVGGADGPSCGGTLASRGHNVDADGTCRFDGPGDRSGVDPMLAPLADNGGPTDTMALLEGSPAIDEGDACPATDQRGATRAQGARCDAGALESPFTAPVPAPLPPPTTPPAPPPPVITPPGPPSDTTPPKLTIGRIAKTVKRSALKGGLKVRIGANEPISADLELLVAPRRVTIARAPDLALATRSLGRGAGTRTVALKPRRRLTGKRAIPAQLRIVAYDAAGNRTAKTITFSIK